MKINHLGELHEARSTPPSVEKKETQALAQEIIERISRVPQSVMEGDVCRTRDWKAKAFKAMKLTERSAPKLEALRHAVDALRHFG